MVAGVLTGLLLITSPQQGDSSTFRDGATAELYARARVRHVRQNSLVRDYRATVRTRMDVTAGRSRFSRQTALLVHETVALVTWRAPNDLKVEALGARSAAPVFGIVADMGAGADRELREDFRQEVLLDRPWFIPRAFGDSITLMGVPEHAAVHPLASGASEFYRYAIVDSLTLVVPGRTVRAIRMDVRPKSPGASLVAGEMWIDGESADVVRLVVVFIGERLWSAERGDLPRDSAVASRDNQWANRFIDVEAEVEYALIEGRYWLPHRQLLAITVDIPWFINASLPARAVSTFIRCWHTRGTESSTSQRTRKSTRDCESLWFRWPTSPKHCLLSGSDDGPSISHGKTLRTWLSTIEFREGQLEWVYSFVRDRCSPVCWPWVDSLLAT
jgi:hypothetical protein